MKYLIITLLITYFSFEVSSQNLVANFSFDNGIPHDVSANRFQVIVHGAQPTVDYTGSDTSAFLFDGIDDYMEINNNIPIITSETFTIVVTAKMNGQGGGFHDHNPLFHQRDNETILGRSKIGLFTENNTGTTFGLNMSDHIGGGVAISTPRMNYGDWHCYVATFDTAKTLRLYIDAELKNSTQINQSGNFVTSIDYVDIARARYVDINAGYFNGVIGEVIILDDAISEVELDSYCNALNVSTQNTVPLSELILFPNPATDFLTVSFDDQYFNDYQISILNHLGEVVLQQENSKFLNIENLSNGFYMATISSNFQDRTVNRKFIVNR